MTWQEELARRFVEAYEKQVRMTFMGLIDPLDKQKQTQEPKRTNEEMALSGKSPLEAFKQWLSNDNFDKEWDRQPVKESKLTKQDVEDIKTGKSVSPYVERCVMCGGEKPDKKVCGFCGKDHQLSMVECPVRKDELADLMEKTMWEGLPSQAPHILAEVARKWCLEQYRKWESDVMEEGIDERFEERLK